MADDLEMADQAVTPAAPKAKNKKASNWPDACVRIAEIAALTGNFLPFLAVATVVVICWTLDSGDLKDVLINLINQVWFAVLGWLMFIGTAVVSVVLFKWKDRMHNAEITRNADLKNVAMQKHFDLELTSSKKSKK